MTISALPARPARPARSGRFLAELEGASPVGFVPPTWFAPVMGSGILAVALVGLPFEVPGARGVALGFWLLAVGLLLAAVAATVAHHVRHPRVARAHREDPVLAHYYGAPAMALMTVGAGAVLVGTDLVGARAAVAMDVVLWSLGTLLGLATAVAVPLRVWTRPDVRADDAFGGWLMPVVPAMVSAATGSLLVARAPAGVARPLLVACYALFGLALVASVAVTAVIVRRLVRLGVGPAAGVPTLWIVLGWLGQSVTATHLLGELAPGVLPGGTGRRLQDLALVYGAPMLALALLWLVLVAVLTLATARRRLPFTMAWWSFTFPLGTVVTGASGLAAATGDPRALQVLAGALMLLLLAAWTLVAVRTAHGTYVGRLLRVPA